MSVLTASVLTAIKNRFRRITKYIRDSKDRAKARRYASKQRELKAALMRKMKNSNRNKRRMADPKKFELERHHFGTFSPIRKFNVGR